MKLKTSLQVLFILILPSLVYAQNEAAPDFSAHVLDKGLGKVVAGDVDNDGITDLIKKAGLKGESMVLFKFDKTGNFKKYVLLDKINFRGDRLALADVDKDGDLDLAIGIGNNDSNGKEINLDVVWVENPMPKNPTRANAWRIHKVGNQKDYIKDIDLADFDHDGKLDIVTRANEKTAIYFQSSPTQWKNEVIIEHESHEGMDIGDMDKDGDTDIVLNGFWYETPKNARATSEYKKHIFDAKWFTKVDNTWRDNNAALKVVDMNKDGLLDILISHSELTGFPISLYLASSLEGLRSDQWTEIQVAETFDFCQTLDAADVDNDGDMDVLAAKFRRNPSEGSQFVNNPPYPIVIYYNVDGSARVWKKHQVAEDGMYAGALADLGSNGSMDIVGPQSYFEGPTKMFTSKFAGSKQSLDKWTYIQVDDSRDGYVIPGAAPWWNYFGVDMYDVNRDGYSDIVAGEWYYRNPGGDMSSKWERITFPVEVDAVLALDADGDEFADVIGLRLPQIFWLEATDKAGTSWSYVQIGSMRQTGHANAQEYSLAQIVPGGKPELVLGDEVSQYYFVIPDNPENTPWPHVTISSEGGGYATGDIDQDGFIDLVGSIRQPGVGEVMEGTSDVKKDNSMMSWWKNPGNGKGNWTRFEVGTGTSPERCIVEDLNGDGKLDIATSDERYPGNVRNANLTWYENKSDPSKKGWIKHIIVTSKSMNSMDAADIDRDGDIDLVVGEHEMMGRGMTSLPKDEKVIVFENNGKGTFTPHTVDQGKESHLGTQLDDLDGDGDLDIVSIAWREPKYLHVWRNDAIKNNTKPEKISSTSNKKFSLPITVNGNGFLRIDKPVEVQLNFTSLLGNAGLNPSFSEKSLHLVEVNSSGEVVNSNVPFQFDKAAEFDAGKKALGALVFILQGKTSPDQSRHFRLYFDDKDHPQYGNKKLVGIEQAGVYEGFDAFKIKTPAAEYYYHPATGGFASIIDKEGNDWVSYHANKEPESGMKGRYRGIPNIAPPELHPGEAVPKKSSRVISEGPVRVTLMTETEDKKWQTRWDIYPDYATMTLLKKGPEPYWILYEGTPGGEFNEEDYWVRSDGTREAMKPYAHKTQWTGNLPSPKWVYFGDHKSDRVLYYIHHEDYPYEDVFWHSGEGNMTVFGFGRGPGQDNWQQLTKAPAHLTLGFAEKNDFGHVSERINSSYKGLKISVGKVSGTK
ncbi:MAG: VCBS repeat-containing protein [Cyclobacteriaceae bacterium]